jgi:CMP/dCMP kinase
MPVPGPASTQKIISLTGDLGSGKSTVASILEQRWGIKRYYAGGFFRELALQRGLTISEITNLEKYGPQFDYMVDAKFKELADTGADFIGEGRVAWHCLPQSFKVKLNVNAKIAADRIFQDKMRKAEHVDPSGQILETILARQKNDDYRYKEIYGIDISNEANFDLVIDTANVTPQAVADLLERLTGRYFNHEAYEKHWISPRSLYPSAEAVVNGGGLELPPDEFDNSPVIAVDIDRHYLIIDGHTRTSKAIMAGVPFIPVRTVRANEDVLGKHMTGIQFFKKHLNHDFIHGWENLHGFKFSFIPDPS